jgi:type VI protein secretion system component Hcp
MRKAVLAVVVLFTAANLFGASPACTQPNLLIPTIQGEICGGAISFTTASFTAPSTTSSGATGSGAGAGRTTPGTLSVTKVFDSSSPALMLACSQGKHFQTVTLSYPSGQNPVTITFGEVTVATLTENINPTNESVQFSYGKIMVQSGGAKVTGSVLGNARASSMTASVVGSDGKSHSVSHASLTVRPGGTTFNSVQLAPPPPGLATTKAGISSGGDRPAESINFNYGKLQIEYRGQTSAFQFNGGTLVNGNLRVSRASYTGPTAAPVHP